MCFVYKSYCEISFSRIVSHNLSYLIITTSEITGLCFGSLVKSPQAAAKVNSVCPWFPVFAGIECVESGYPSGPPVVEYMRSVENIRQNKSLTLFPVRLSLEIIQKNSVRILILSREMFQNGTYICTLSAIPFLRDNHNTMGISPSPVPLLQKSCRRFTKISKQ